MRPSLHLLTRVLALSAAAAFLGQCSGRPQLPPPPADLGVVAGRVIKGNVAGATVTVYRLEGTHRGAVAGTATTEADGAFRIGVGTSTGPFLVVASGGSFVDEATGVTVQLNSAELTALVPVFEVETKLESLRVTPISHLAAGLALFWTEAEGKQLAAADAEAWQHLNLHFGGLDWRSSSPTDLPTATGAHLDEPARAGLILAALSYQARLVAEADGLTPGGRVNPLQLIRALHDDVTADGFFDGLGAGGVRLVLPQGGLVTDAGPTATALDGQTARTSLAQGVAKFLASDRNPTSITLADAQQLITALASNTDSRIFRDTAGPADVEAPVITFVKPSEGAGVHGSVDVEVRAVDNVAMSSLAFTAPAALVPTAATTSTDGKTSTLRATLDVSALADGALDVIVRAADSSKNEATKTLHLLVNNHGPAINVTAPVEGSTVRGLVALNATATAQAGSVTKLELRTPPPGVTADTLPAADAFGATWNSLLSTEGPQSLVFHAEDSLGGTTDVTVTVVVDNVPFGTVRAVVTLGAPVQGLDVRLVAIDDTTGLPVLGRPGGATLGQSTVATDADAGVATFSLSQENYEGPVQVVASGAAAAYIDPTDSATTIALPSSFTVTSYVARYKTGDAVDVPVTGWTTLADSAALAWAQGHNTAQPTPVALTAALRVVDPLFPGHLTRPQQWQLRGIFPVSMTTGPQSMRDVTFAAMPDVALNQLARQLAGEVGLTPGTGFALPHLLEALRRDVGDGQFDGRAGGLQLVTGGTTPYAFDANTSRFRLAIGLDAFIRSPNNRTGLTRQDLQTSAIYDNISGDTSALYPASQPPIPFDNQAPAVTWGVSFSNGGQQGLAPVGANHLVAGVVALDVAAVDGSGVASIAVTANGQALAPGAGSSSSRFLSSFTTSGDGAVTFAATSCDRLANCDTVTYVALADNTAPTVTLTRPSSTAFFSAPFDIEATATDTNGLATFVALSTADQVDLADQDAALGRVYAPGSSWRFGPNVVNGPMAASVRACDVVANCRDGSVSATVDLTPPGVSLSSIPPPFTNASSVIIRANITDFSSGVVRAKAMNRRTLVPVNGNCTPATGASVNCTFDVPLDTSNVDNTIDVWGEDGAIPSNGTSSTGASVTVTRDTTAPVAEVRSVASYRDERNLAVATDALGRPVMPVQYLYAGGPLAVNEGGVVWKIYSKTTASDANVPFLRWAVPTPLPTQSPLASATFAVTDLPGGCAGRIPACPSGNLRLSAANETNYVLYELPLHLGTLGAPGNVTLRVVFTDGAGNSSTPRIFSIGYMLAGAPIVVVRDTAFPSYGDASSVWPYSATSGYNALIGATRRVVRWLVFNPNAETVWASLRHSGTSGAWTESWFEGAPYRAGDVGDDGQGWPGYVDWYSKLYPQWIPIAGECSGPGRAGINPFPCDPSEQANGGTQPSHYLGDTGNFLRCEPRLAHFGNGQDWSFGLTNNFAVGAGLDARSNPLPTGQEPMLAPAVTFAGLGGWSIPPATVNTASAIALYATVITPARPTTGIAAANFPISGSGAQVFRAGWTYRYEVNDSQLACEICRGFACLDYHGFRFNQGWYSYYFDRYLNSFAFTYGGSLAVSTNPYFEQSNATAPSTWATVPFTK